MLRRRPAEIVLAGVVLAAGAVALALLSGDERPRDDSRGTTAPAPVRISGSSYYVSPRGSDDAEGTSPARAWATVARANQAQLRPGDAVLFQGGAIFEDDELTPARSGTATAPVIYGTYGRGRARLKRSVFLRATSFVVIQDLEIEHAGQGIASLGSTSSGARGIVIQRNRIRGTSIAINSANPADANWTIRANHIERTGDSAVIVAGERVRIEDNTIEGAGLDTGIDYGKHGIYLKGSHGTVTGNRIRDFPDGSAVSVRRHESRVEGNDIAQGAVGISWFQEDTTAGTSHWRANHIANTSQAGIYVSPTDEAGPTRESFIIANNTLSRAAGLHLNLAPTTGRYTIKDNTRVR